MTLRQRSRRLRQVKVSSTLGRLRWAGLQAQLSMLRLCRLASITFQIGDRLAQGAVRRVFQLAENRRGLIGMLSVVATVVLSVVSWEWLQTIPDGAESGSTTVRNLSFVFAGLVALPLAIWRSLVSQSQADAAQRQSETAQQDLLNERYQRGAEMLGSNTLSVRLGGIYALQRLATEHPRQYHVQIMQLLCAFACHSTNEQNSEPDSASLPDRISGIRRDIHSSVLAISSCHAKQSAVEKAVDFQLDLAGVNLSDGQLDSIDLSGAKLWGANLSGASLATANLRRALLNGADLSNSGLREANMTDTSLSGANLTGARLYRADLSRAALVNANLSNVNLRRAILKGASLRRANLTGANLIDSDITSARFSSNNGRYPAIGLIQTQLNAATAEKSSPPKLVGVADSVTAKSLIWSRQ